MDNMLNIIKLKAYSTTLIIVEVYNKKIFGTWINIKGEKMKKIFVVILLGMSVSYIGNAKVKNEKIKNIDKNYW